jgi:hypothetical protein
MTCAVFLFESVVLESAADDAKRHTKRMIAKRKEEHRWEDTNDDRTERQG